MGSAAHLGRTDFLTLGQEISKGVGGVIDLGKKYLGESYLGETDFLTPGQEMGEEIGDDDLSKPGPLYPIRRLCARACNPKADKIKELLYT